ncbi:ATP synthase gamma chain [Iodidimonas muriae]|uniref:ATP synthase gamma chain n=1 Tax=Iodidimonas muriae TaxID=261467 RepID=A0ABQ2L8R4_9PROT|nr:F0F1 ATP synthase subunit gamma [Iodidimonas muriae]GER05817.1 ATP synthase gamma chain [Kordiimonadales bacterium JCM 17843]GGO06999.1 ATP synthase gamma chain [Iodidimonas muriae]
MASLKDLRNRIASVKSTQKITKAMKMVAASKLKRAQEAAESARPYAERMDKVMGALGQSVANLPGASPLLVGNGQNRTYLVVVATSERGLCGGFNTNIVRAAKRRIDALLAEGKDVKILCVGRKGRAQLQRFYGTRILDTVDMGGTRYVGFSDAARIAERVRVMFDEGVFDVAVLFYARFQSALTQIATEQQLIPVPLPDADQADGLLDAGGDAIYEYEPNEEAILDDLLPRNVSVQVYRALLENAASEQGARMTAMDAATRNAGDLIDRLTIQYNRTRQAVITKELIEIISGAEAL